MAVKKKIKERPEESYWKPLISDELLFRIMTIAGQTGVSPPDIILKWVLQEEALIGFMKNNKEPMKEHAETRPSIDPQKNTAVRKKRAETIPSDSGGPNYRKTLIKRAQKLKKDGMTLKKIAETFNEEKVLTVSETGKWYASSVSNLLKPKK